MGDVEKIKTQLGSPEVFLDDEVTSSVSDDSTSEKSAETESNKPFSKRKLFRDKTNGIIGGVASGLSLYFDIDVVLIRVVMLVLMFATFGVMVPIYLILWMVVPRAKNASDILQATGQRITATSLKDINQQYNFAETNKQNKTFIRIFKVIFGTGALLAAFGGLMAIFSFDYIVFSQRLENTYSADVIGWPIVLFNLAGIAFVAFAGLIAYMSITFKAKPVQLAILGILTFLGISTFTSGVVMVGVNNNLTQQVIEQSLEKHELNIDTAKLSQVNTLKVDSGVRIEYVESKTPHVEYYRYGYFTDQDFKPKFEFNNQTLLVEAKMNNNEKFTRDYLANEYEKLVIYGPALTMVEDNFTSGNSRIVYKTEQNQLKFTVKLNESARFELSGRQKIAELNLELADTSSFEAKNLTVEKLKITGLRSTDVTVWSADDISLNGQFRCEDDRYGAKSFELEYNNSPNLTLNGEKIDESKLMCTSEAEI